MHNRNKQISLRLNVSLHLLRFLIIMDKPPSQALQASHQLHTLPSEYKIGMIVDTDCTYRTYTSFVLSMCITGGAMNIAMDYLATDQLTDGFNFT